jgi:hypothetical protein
MKPVIIILITGTLSSLFYLHALNRLTEMRLEIPKIERKLRTVEEEIEKIRFEIERSESPRHLEELLKNPDLNSFIYPKESEVIFR